MSATTVASRTLTLLISIVAILLFIQGVTRHELIPLLSAVSTLIGVNISSPANFFIYPFVNLVISFLDIFIRALYTNKIVSGDRALNISTRFLDFLTEFFRWITALWLAMMASGAMVLTKIIPGGGEQLFFVLINFYLAFFFSMLVIRRMARSDFLNK